MKSKKTASSRRRISFAVDRDEIEVNSDWVEAVMAKPNRHVADLPASPPPDPAPKTPQGLFFAPDTNNATDELNAPGAGCSSVEITAAVVETATVVQSAPVALITPVVTNTPVAHITPVANVASVEHSATVSKNVPVAVPPIAVDLLNSATGVETATGALLGGGTRVWRPRPIRRITDGLTPGQYAVYRLMYEAADGAGESPRIYTGGYADLRRLTGLSKRGIQNIVAELQTKLVLRVHQRPGYHRTQTTSYAVPDAENLLEIWAANGWRNAVGKSKTLTG
jgi:hypothetical protein